MRLNTACQLDSHVWRRNHDLDLISRQHHWTFVHTQRVKYSVKGGFSEGGFSSNNRHKQSRWGSSVRFHHCVAHYSHDGANKRLMLMFVVVVITVIHPASTSAFNQPERLLHWMFTACEVAWRLIKISTTQSEDHSRAESWDDFCPFCWWTQGWGSSTSWQQILCFSFFLDTLLSQSPSSHRLRRLILESYPS